jgi:hypothetical protein
LGPTDTDWLSSSKVAVVAVPAWTVKVSPGLATIDFAETLGRTQLSQVTETTLGLTAAIAGALVPKPATATTPAALRTFRARTTITSRYGARG